MKVCIAEKPSVAKEIAHILGAKTRNNGYFEGNGYQVTWTFGHLCTLKEPQDYQENLKYWNINTLPIIPPKYEIKLIKNKGVKEQFEVIKKLFTEATEIINCGDAGQEGELIQRWVIKEAGAENKPTKRLWISSLTEEAIKEGFNNLKDAKDYDRLFYAGSSRAIGDWLLGINATRLYTMKYAPKGTVLSIGRVQTPTLAMIVGRFKEIENFVSEDFWELKTKYKNVLFSSNKGKLKDKEKAEALLEQIKDCEFTITNFEQKEGKESATKLFDLTSLQVDCNKKFNLGADETLKIAQSLYEKKYLTYPRVDTQYLPNDVYPKIEGILKSLRSYESLTTILIGQQIRKSKSVFNDKKVTDHHAIIPTNLTASGLYGDEAKVYDLVAKRFIANFYPDCKVSRTTVLGIAQEINFKATGKQILEPGWRDVYTNDTIDEDDDDSKKEESSNQLLPHFDIGEKGPHKPLLEQKKTNPPKIFTEATLLRAMETAGKQVDDESLRDLMKENGIGRPSTRANIIQTLFRRKYVVKQRKNLVPTITGIQLIDTIKHDMLKSAELTGKWEKNLKDIESGTYSIRQFMHEMNHFVSEVVHQVKYDYNASKIQVSEKGKELPKKEAAPKKEVDTSCPKCKKGNVIKGKSLYGCSEFKNNCDFRLPFEFANKKLTDSHIKQLITKSKTSLIKGIELDGKKADGSIILNKEFKLEFIVKEAAVWTCPKCKSGTLIKGNSAYGCNRYQNGCRFIVPFTIAEKKLTEKQIEVLILKGRTPVIKGLSQNGEKINGRLILNKEFAIEITQN